MMRKNSFNKNVPTSSNKEKQYTKNQNEGSSMYTYRVKYTPICLQVGAWSLIGC